ncbi:MAG: LemA family protein [Planctomycetota bacterium]
MNGAEPAFFVIIGVLLVILLWFFGTYNGLVRLRNHMRESWHNIDVQLKRRYDLIPNLVSTVKGYAKHEQELLERVMRERAKAHENHGSVASQEADERPLVRSLGRLIALQEAYPDLKADTQFLALQEELVDTEDRIAAARRFFNANVRDYNSRCETMPSAIVAGMFGHKPESFWEVEEASVRENPALDL